MDILIMLSRHNGHMKVTKRKLQELIEVLDDLREDFFKDRRQKYPYSEWERKREIVKERLRSLPKYVQEAVDAIKMEDEKNGRPQKLDLDKKLTLFLYTRWLSKTNRGMEEALELFQPLFGFDVSYKYIERLYSDEEVRLALHNLFVLLLKEEGSSGNFSGDGTGYSIKVERHYRLDPKKYGKKYLYFFAIIDLATGLYVACGFSKISEKRAFNNALQMLKENSIEMDAIRLDKYYSSGKTLKLLGKKVKVFVIPKKGMANIGLDWARVLRMAIGDPFLFLSEYLLRNNSESGFSSDKRRFGWSVRQKRDERQEAALFSFALLHNLHAFKVMPR
jgi:transposase